VLAVAEKASATTWSIGREQGHIGVEGLVQELLGQFDLVLLAERLTDAHRPGFQEGVSHPTADDEDVHLVEQALDDVDLRGDLRAADDGHEGAFRVGQGFPKVLDLFHHQEPRRGLRHVLGDAFRGGVGR
jgi:hypothetical protein